MSPMDGLDDSRPGGIEPFHLNADCRLHLQQPVHERGKGLLKNLNCWSLRDNGLLLALF